MEKEKERKKEKTNIGDLRDNIKHDNLHIVGIPEEERENGLENVFKEIIAEDPQSKEENRYQGIGSTEGPKQTHTKTHYN